MVRDQVLESDNDRDGDESSLRYFTDPELAEANNRSLASLIASRRCFACRQADDDAPSASSPADQYLDSIAEHCSQDSDYLPPDTPLKEAIFRVILSGRNQPMTPEEINEVLAEKWASAVYHRDVSPRVLRRLLNRSEFYSVTPVLS